MKIGVTLGILECGSGEFIIFFALTQAPLLPVHESQFQNPTHLPRFQTSNDCVRGDLTMEGHNDEALVALRNMFL